MIKGFRFTNQLANAEVDARIHQEFLNKNDGIFYGMDLSKTNNSITISEGLCEIAGRPVAVVGEETISSGSENLYCLLVLEIDLSKESTKDTFGQAYFKLVTSSSYYPTVTQQEINRLDKTENIYQLEFARFKSGTNGITDFKDTRTFLKFDSIYTQIKSECESIINQIKEELKAVEDGSAYTLKGKTLYENNDGKDIITLSDDISNYNKLEIFYGINANQNILQNSVSYDVKLGGGLNLIWTTQDEHTIIFRTSTWEIKQKQIKRIVETKYDKGDNSIGASNETKIFKVVGVK